jgi:ATP dependent DNA ligase C terminal region
VPPPRSTRFGSPLVLSRVHWVQPALVAEVKFLTWTEDNLLRQVVYEGLREDKPAPRCAVRCHIPKRTALQRPRKSKRRSPRDRLWRAATLMLKRYGERALEESASRADELASAGDDNGVAVWRRISDAIGQLVNTTPPGAVH